MIDTANIYRKDIPEEVVIGKRLGRAQVVHDARSWRFPAPMAAKIASVRHKSVGLPLDQGDLGSCTGNAMVAMLNSEPFFSARQKAATTATGRAILTEEDAVKFYGRATHIDRYKGVYPPDDTGSNGLAVCKAAAESLHVDGYSWCFGLDHMLRTLTLQPTIGGFNWYDSFDKPNSHGIVHISKGATVRGGHEWALVGIDVAAMLVACQQSWGDWGLGGIFFVTYDDLDRLLHEDGDIKTGRVKGAV